MPMHNRRLIPLTLRVQHTGKSRAGCARAGGRRLVLVPVFPQPVGLRAHGRGRSDGSCGRRFEGGARLWREWGRGDLPGGWRGPRWAHELAARGHHGLGRHHGRDGTLPVRLERRQPRLGPPFARVRAIIIVVEKVQVGGRRGHLKFGERAARGAQPHVLSTRAAHRSAERGDRGTTDGMILTVLGSGGGGRGGSDVCDMSCGTSERTERRSGRGRELLVSPGSLRRPAEKARRLGCAARGVVRAAPQRCARGGRWPTSWCRRWLIPLSHSSS
jgi:hypothetical protein